MLICKYFSEISSENVGEKVFIILILIVPTKLSLNKAAPIYTLINSE